MIDVAKLNQDGWDRRVAEQDVWTRPVCADEVARARVGDWDIVLTPSRAVPRGWFGDLRGRDVLGLASGGGQQGPILAAAGARVTVFDASPRQLAQDAMVAARDGLALTTRLGFMHDLSCFAEGSFDLILHPAANCFAPDLAPVWRECFRVLRPGGALLAGFMNPDVYIFDRAAQERGEFLVRFPLPYADVTDLPAAELQALIDREHVVEFSHSLEAQIGGQLRAGFLLTDFFEDRWDGHGITQYMPALFATRAVKPG